MAITDPLRLPANVVLVPVEDFPGDIREQMGYEPGDYVITRTQSRTPSRLIDAHTAELLKEFQTPKTIVEAVIRYSQAREAAPEQTLDEAFPLIQRFLDERLLVPADSGEESQIVPSFESGEQIAAWEVVRCFHVLEDTELYQVQRANGERAALKLLRPGYEEKVQHTFEREIAVLEHLDGRVNPALLEAGTLAGRRYLVLEWCDGVDALVAAEEFRRQPGIDGRKKLLDLCRSILEAYAYLHAQQVIHSDVHPRNVLVDSDNAVKIIDYGFARLEGRESEFDGIPRAGVGFFFEPEYAKVTLAGRRPPQSSMLGEQYALAALLYFLFSGVHYVDFSLEKYEMLRQIAEDRPLPFARRGVRPWPEVEQLLARALSKNPRDRFPSVATFAGELNKIPLSEQPRDPMVARDAKPAGGKAAEEVLNAVLQQVGLTGPLLASGVMTAPTSSVNLGAAGIAYALYRIARLRSDARLLSMADIWATKASRDIGREEAFYNSDNDITPERVGRISPFHTESGVHCVQAFIGHAMGDVASQQAAIRSFIATSKAPCENLDLTLGRSGTLLACSLLLDISVVLDCTALLELGNETMRIVWNTITTLAPIRECPEIVLGMAHGWAGMLYATMRWCQSSGRALPSTFGERLQQLAACAEPVGRGVHWSWAPPVQSRGYVHHSMPGWCHGSAGYVHLWTLAYQMLADEAYLALAEKAAWNAWEEPVALGTLCCGLAGRAYGLLNLYKQTSERSWLHRAQELANRAAVSAEAMDEYTHSLYRGKTGTAVLAAELARPEAACMPFFEQEGWRAYASNH